MKRFLYVIIIFAAAASIFHSAQSIYSLWKKQDILIATQKTLQKEKKENQNLKQQLHGVSDPAFIEEEARNKLFLVKPGESTVFIAKNLIATKSAELLQVQGEPNWKKWIEVFF